MDAAHASFAPDKAIMLIDPADEASASFWREQNPEALAMAEGNFNSPVILQEVPAPLSAAVLSSLANSSYQGTVFCSAAVMVTPVQPAGFDSVP